MGQVSQFYLFQEGAVMGVTVVLVQEQALCHKGVVCSGWFCAALEEPVSGAVKFVFAC